jgi:mono/diheme cytochrome c family protein
MDHRVSRRGGCAALLALGLAALALAALARPARAETPLERGAYLVRGLVACGNCHTPKDAAGKPLPGMELAGGLVIELPVFKAVTPNITPDAETGIGKWTDDQIVAAIREGRRPDGSIIGPPMPIEMYRGMADRDVRAIVAYLRRVKPVRHAVGKSVFKIPLPPSYGPPLDHVAAPSRKDKRAYGAYLATALGHCMECHTPRLEDGRLDMTRIGAGGQVLPTFGAGGGMVASANLTPDREHGLGAWSDAAIRTAITTGVRPDGSKLATLMAFDWYAHIKRADLDALVAYLRSLKAQP